MVVDDVISLEQLGVGEMSSKNAQDRKDKIALRQYRLSIASLIVSILALIGPLTYTIWHDFITRQSVDTRFGLLDARSQRIETAIRMLTAAVAPQMQKAVDDSFNSALSSSSNDQSRKLNLKKAAESLQVLQDSQVPQTEKDVTSTTRLASLTTEMFPQTPESWQAASAVISYSSASRSSFLNPFPNRCVDQVTSYVPHPPLVNSRRWRMEVANCTIVIDDLDAFYKSSFGHIYKTEIQDGVTDTAVLVGQNLSIIYTGHKLIPFSMITCDACRFLVQLKEVPSPGGEDLIAGMLNAQQGHLSVSSIQISGSYSPPRANINATSALWLGWPFVR